MKETDKSWKVLILILAVGASSVVAFFVSMLLMVSGYFYHSNAVAILVGIAIGIGSQVGLFTLALLENRTVAWKALSGLFILPYLLVAAYYFIGSFFATDRMIILVAALSFFYYYYATIKWWQLKTEARNTGA